MRSKIKETRKKDKETKGREKTFTEEDKQEQIRRPRLKKGNQINNWLQDIESLKADVCKAHLKA